MARIKLTAGRVSGFTTERPQAFLWDTEVPGLAVRATKAGSRAFIFQGKLAGKSVRITIGDVRAWGIDQAREEARRLQNLLDQGRDPREAKREVIAAEIAKREERRREDMTVAEAWAAYVKARAHKWSDRHRADHEKLARLGGEEKKRGTGTTAPGPLAALMQMRLADLTPERAASWLQEEAGRRPTQAALAYRLLRTFMHWCADSPEHRAIVHADAVSSRRVRDHVPKGGVKDDCLQREQLRLWFEAVRRVSNPVASAYLQTLLLTGARREELAGLRWTDVDFQWKSLTIHDKVEGERVIPLTPYVATLLAALPRRNEWVFSSPAAASGRIQEPRIAHNKALAAAGLPSLTLHGLRRSFGTLAEWVEAPTGVVAQIMGHKPSAIAEKHYRRRPLDLLRMWHTKIEAWMLEQAGIEQPSEQDAAAPLRLVKGGDHA